MREQPWLFETFDVRDIPWMPIGNFPTPIHRLENLEKFLGYDGIWIKRDDKSSNIYGGNKVRKFEFVLADAKRKNAKWVMSFGGLGSNQTVALTIYASKLGMKTISVLVYQPITEHVLKNLWLMHYFGSHISYAGNVPRAVLKAIWHILTKRKLYVVPVGASSPLGTLGYVDAMIELKKDVDEGRAEMPRAIFVAVGSCGTYAGLLVGKKLLGLDDVKIIGIAVSKDSIKTKERVLKLARKTYKLLKEHASVPEVKIDENDIIIDDNYLGRCYGDPTRESVKAVILLKKLENVELETTYTGKTIAALIDYARRGIEGPILFWNTFNSVDLSYAFKEMDYKKMPKNLWRFFMMERAEKKIEEEVNKEVEKELREAGFEV